VSLGLPRAPPPAGRCEPVADRPASMSTVQPCAIRIIRCHCGFGAGANIVSASALGSAWPSREVCEEPRGWSGSRLPCRAQRPQGGFTPVTGPAGLAAGAPARGAGRRTVRALGLDPIVAAGRNPSSRKALSYVGTRT
jgi:hypothetical protein